MVAINKELRLKPKRQKLLEISGHALRGGSAKLLKDWWTWSGSNRRPLPCHGSALPAAPQAHSGTKSGRFRSGVIIDCRVVALVRQTRLRAKAMQRDNFLLMILCLILLAGVAASPSPGTPASSSA